MIRAGRTYTLEAVEVSDYGLYLSDDERTTKVLLPNRYVSLSDRVGDMKEVFIYHDSEDRLVATTERPYLRVGEAGFLRVVDKTLHGAFLDWGLKGKDLFLPNRNQQGGVTPDRPCLVYVYEDAITGRCVATSKLKSFIYNDGELTVEPRQQVDILVASRAGAGFRVIVNNRHTGMIYDNQLFAPVHIGDRLKGYVCRITDDNRIDIVLGRPGYDGVKDSAEKLLSIVAAAGGLLPLGDDSEPALIADKTGMSKKQFKRALGVLLKSGAVTVDGDGIKQAKR